MIDEATFQVKAGNGGDGAVSFRREKYVPKGGPDGGDGGNGGSIYLVTDKNLNTLQFFAGKNKFKADHGGRGEKRNRHGKNAEDLELKVPVGTVVKQKFENSEDQILVDLNEPDVRFLVAKGGTGGRGNTFFKSSTNTTPREAETGTLGEEKLIKLELKVLAQVGLVGLPNAGKSTLLSVLTRAQPKIANYPFTTLEPNLGVMELPERSDGIVIADIPGLIEGAHEGKGLGVRFLKHIERCEVLVYVLFSQEEWLTLSGEKLAERLWKQYKEVQGEVSQYNERLLSLPSVIVANKVDLLPEKVVGDVSVLFKQKKLEILLTSAATRAGLDELKNSLIWIFTT